jgi:hypothetical protein
LVGHVTEQAGVTVKATFTVAEHTLTIGCELRARLFLRTRIIAIGR